jgi:hypothetical protein
VSGLPAEPFGRVVGKADKWMVANALSKRSRAEIFEFVGSNTVNVEDVYFLPIRMSQLLGALAE